MHGLGTIINAAAIVVGSILGMALKGGLPKRFEKTIMSAVGLSVSFIGISGALAEMFAVDGNSVSTQYVMLMVLSLVIGGVLGEAVNIEYRLEQLGIWCRKKAAFLAGDNPAFVDGFVSASLLFCVGAMAIVGSISDGLTGDYTTLAAKAVLDGVTSLVMAASMGSGVLLSAVAVAVYQGIITMLASFLSPVMTDVLISQMAMVGSVLIAGIGINMLFDKKLVKVGNLLPAVIIPIFYQIAVSLF